MGRFVTRVSAAEMAARYNARMIEIGISELLANPVQYDGKQVAVVGWFVNQHEHCAIYNSQLNPRASISRFGIWVVNPETQGGRAAVTALSRHWVRVVGRFDNRRKSGCGHFNGWPAQIRGLKELKEAEPPHDKSVP